MIKIEWFGRYNARTVPSQFDFVFQSWDTANKNTELSDYSVCTTWGVFNKYFYLLDVFRKRLDYPELKRAVLDQRRTFSPSIVIIEDKASGTQLIQELISESQCGIVRYTTKLDKVMRMHSSTSTIESGRVLLPEQAVWLDVFTHELATFPRSKYDDQADSVSQALDWMRQRSAVGQVQVIPVYL